MYRIGIDLGGTNVKLGIVDPDFRILDQSSCKTQVQAGTGHVIKGMAAQVWAILKKTISPLRRWRVWDWTARALSTAGRCCIRIISVGTIFPFKAFCPGS